MSKKKRNFKITVREKEQSQRQLKVSQLIKIALLECLRKSGKLSPLLDGCPLSITKVNISADLRVANCFFLPFNTKLSHNELLEALESSKYIIRDYVTSKVHLKYSPEIRFYYDSVFDNVMHIEELLKK